MLLRLGQTVTNNQQGGLAPKGTSMKVIEFFGVTYEIEDRFNYVALDQVTGEIYVSEQKPHIGTCGEIFHLDRGRVEILGSLFADTPQVLEVL